MEANQYVDFIGGLAEENQVELSDSEIQEIIDKYNRIVQMVFDNPEHTTLDPELFFSKQIESIKDRMEKVKRIKKLLIIINNYYKTLTPEYNSRLYLDESSTDAISASLRKLRFKALKHGRFTYDGIEIYLGKIIDRLKLLAARFKNTASSIIGQKCVLLERHAPGQGSTYYKTKITRITQMGYIGVETKRGDRHPDKIFKDVEQLRETHPDENIVEEESD